MQESDSLEANNCCLSFPCSYPSSYEIILVSIFFKSSDYVQWIIFFSSKFFPENYAFCLKFLLFLLLLTDGRRQLSFLFFIFYLSGVMDTAMMLGFAFGTTLKLNILIIFYFYYFSPGVAL